MFTMPKKFTSNCRRASCAGVNSIAPEMPKPALLMRMSMRPSRHVCLQVRYARLRVFGAAAELIHVETAAAQGTRGVQADARTAAGDDGHARFGGG